MFSIKMHNDIKTKTYNFSSGETTAPKKKYSFENRKNFTDINGSSESYKH